MGLLALARKAKSVLDLAKAFEVQLLPSEEKNFRRRVKTGARKYKQIVFENSEEAEGKRSERKRVRYSREPWYPTWRCRQHMFGHHVPKQHVPLLCSKLIFYKGFP